LVWIGIPLYWTLKTSISPEAEVWEVFPKNPTLQNFIDLFAPRAGGWAEIAGITSVLAPTVIPVRNSLLVALTVASISVVIGSFAGYNLARFSYKGKKIASYYVVFAYVFPPFILMVPLMMTLSHLGLINTLHGLTLVHLAYTVPFSTYMLRGYFMGVPRDLEDAALIDGCSRLQALFRVVLPVAAPGLVTAAIFSFTLSWGDLIFALVTLNSVELYTLPVQTTFFLYGGEVVDPGLLAATIVVGGAVPVILYMIVQKYVVMGLIKGAVKY
jgi:multiple sugar transport system permease protein